jgi:hypothetical protein
LVLALALWTGCAEGVPEADVPDAPDTSMLPKSGTGIPLGGGRAAAGGRGPSSGGSGSLYMGDSCMAGETEPCMCPGNMGKGTRVCRHDADSPTEGTFSECEQCVPDQQPMAGKSSGGTGSSSGGRGGSSSSSGSAGSSSSSGSAGSSSSSGSAGRTSGSGGSSGGSSSGGGGDPGWCLFVPIPLPGLCK